ncbi:Bacteriohemerythrin [Patescibacteria group bacterium]|nr:Bacteriohemerythrin [Patescibacteria group bacterium]
MSLMTWTEEQHGTHVEFADNEHKNVFHNLNILYDLRMEGAGNPELVDQLTILLDIVAAHFDHEEREMKAKNFVDFTIHKAEHDELMETCLAMKTKIAAGELELTERICQLIKRWFDSHIPEYDRAYASVLNS